MEKIPLEDIIKFAIERGGTEEKHDKQWREGGDRKDQTKTKD